MSNYLDQDQDRLLSVLIWVQIVCKGKKQTTEVSMERVKDEIDFDSSGRWLADDSHKIQALFIIFYKISKYLLQSLVGTFRS